METVTNDPTVEVQTIMDGFTPELVDAARFYRVEDLVRTAVAECRPESPARARDLVRYATYLATWCDSEYLPLRDDVVFHPDTVEQFISRLDAVIPHRSSATVASVLRAMVKVVGPEAVAVKQRQHQARVPKAPYRPADVEVLFDLAARSRSAKRRHDLAALLVLCLGAGASGQEAAQVRPDDVVTGIEAVAVRLRRLGVDGCWRERQVTVLDPYAQMLSELAATSGRYLLGGSISRHSRVYDLSDQSRAGRWPVVLDAGRLRATYLCAIARQPHSALELLERAGVATFEVFGDLLVHLRAGDDLPG